MQQINNTVQRTSKHGTIFRTLLNPVFSDMKETELFAPYMGDMSMSPFSFRIPLKTAVLLTHMLDVYTIFPVATSVRHICDVFL